MRLCAVYICASPRHRVERFGKEDVVNRTPYAYLNMATRDNGFSYMGRFNKATLIIRRGDCCRVESVHHLSFLRDGFELMGAPNKERP